MDTKLLEKARAIMYGAAGRPPGLNANERELPPLAWVAEEIRDGNSLRAVKICSVVLEDHFWLILDRSFEPKDILAIYYPEELPELRNKTPKDLREIHKVKLAFPGCRVIQEGAEARG